MNDLISKTDAQVLTKPGFYAKWCSRVAGGETFTAAYEAVEQLHMTVHEKGEMMYSHFGSFRRQHWKQKNKQKQQSPV